MGEKNIKMTQIIKENLENVETGKSLPRTAKDLVKDFKKVYKEKFGDSMRMLSKTVKLNTKKLQTEKRKAYMKAYHQRPEVKARMKAYRQKKKLEKLKGKQNKTKTNINNI